MEPCSEYGYPDPHSSENESTNTSKEETIAFHNGTPHLKHITGTFSKINVVFKNVTALQSKSIIWEGKVINSMWEANLT